MATCDGRSDTVPQLEKIAVQRDLLQIVVALLVLEDDDGRSRDADAGACAADGLVRAEQLHHLLEQTKVVVGGALQVVAARLPIMVPQLRCNPLRRQVHAVDRHDGTTTMR